MYTIIDIETTGGNSKTDKITEIAIVVFDGKNIINQYSTLINPERKIPKFITEITGIDDFMVHNSPKFYEIAKKIIELTESRIFVAHNVNFDYSFIVEEFNRIGYDFKRKKLCTVQQGRKFIKGKKSFSLGKICADLGIEIQNRHRALGDALATVELFKHILKSEALTKPLSLEF